MRGGVGGAGKVAAVGGATAGSMHSRRGRAHWHASACLIATGRRQDIESRGTVCGKVGECVCV